MRGGADADAEQSQNAVAKPGSLRRHGGSWRKDQPTPNGDCVGAPTLFPQESWSPLISPEMGSMGWSRRVWGPGSRVSV